jgi:hypothetical protein
MSLHIPPLSIRSWQRRGAKGGIFTIYTYYSHASVECRDASRLKLLHPLRESSSTFASLHSEIGFQLVSTQILHLAIEIAAIQTKPAYAGFKIPIYGKSVQADFVCVAANSIRPGLVQDLSSTQILHLATKTKPAQAGLKAVSQKW